MPRKLPLDGPLSATADALVRSEDPLEWRAGAGLLGGRDTENGRLQLRSVVENDKNPGVRAAAIEALGWAGDRATLTYLRTLAPALDEDLRGAVDNAVKRLLRKYPD